MKSYVIFVDVSSSIVTPPLRLLHDVFNVILFTIL